MHRGYGIQHAPGYTARQYTPRRAAGGPVPRRERLCLLYRFFLLIQQETGVALWPGGGTSSQLILLSFFKIRTIQRKLAWHLRKDGTRKSASRVRARHVGWTGGCSCVEIQRSGGQTSAWRGMCHVWCSRLSALAFPNAAPRACRQPSRRFPSGLSLRVVAARNGRVQTGPVGPAGRGSLAPLAYLNRQLEIPVQAEPAKRRRPEAA